MSDTSTSTVFIFKAVFASSGFMSIIGFKSKLVDTLLLNDMTCLFS